MEPAQASRQIAKPPGISGHEPSGDGVHHSRALSTGRALVASSSLRMPEVNRVTARALAEVLNGKVFGTLEGD